MNAARVGDILAIPFFLVAILYFAQKGRGGTPPRTPVEDALLLFSTGGLVADVTFVLGGH